MPLGLNACVLDRTIVHYDLICVFAPINTFSIVRYVPLQSDRVVGDVLSRGSLTGW